MECGDRPANPFDLETWTYEQIRLAGAWSKHEIESYFDPLCCPYDWKPAWAEGIPAVQVRWDNPALMMPGAAGRWEELYDVTECD